MLDVKILSVSSAHRQKGLGRLLISETMKIADSKNLAVTVGCSSYFTSRIVAKFDQFQRILRFPIKQYVDSKGKAVFPVQEPHVNYDVYLYEKWNSVPIGR